MTSVGVKRFQSARGISSIGIVGPATRTALNS
jgi:murein L,D-transpeptidase YcbB/YkuD